MFNLLKAHFVFIKLLLTIIFAWAEMSLYLLIDLTLLLFKQEAIQRLHVIAN